MVELPTVNRMVVGSSPATGAKFGKELTDAYEPRCILLMTYKPTNGIVTQ